MIATRIEMSCQGCGFSASFVRSYHRRGDDKSLKVIIRELIEQLRSRGWGLRHGQLLYCPPCTERERMQEGAYTEKYSNEPLPA